MVRRTLFPVGFLALTLAACQSPEPTASVEESPDLSGWRLASGKVPTQAEFAALTASCEDKGGALDPCLAELGLKHAP
jgi:hypothetical protein